MNRKKQILFGYPLKTINEILDELNFLKYSTQKRNLAYQLQLLEFKINLLVEYSIYGSVEGSLLREIVICITNIIEYLLFISLYILYGRKPKSNRLPALIGQSRRKSLLSKDLAKDLNKIVDLRNKLHPSKQDEELDINTFTQENTKFCFSSMNNLINELKRFFGESNTKLEANIEKCPYEGYSQVFFSDFICPLCGEQHY